MEGRCSVETLVEFGFSAAPYATKVEFCFGTNVCICTGSEEVYVCDPQEKKLKAVLQFPGVVSDLVQSFDKQLLYVSCSGGVYCVSASFLLSRVPSSTADASSSIVAPLLISSEFLVIEEEAALSLLLVDSLLLNLSQKDGSWLLTVYKTPAAASHPASSCSYERLSSFILPPGSDSRGGPGRTPVLSCVHAAPKTPSSSPSVSSPEAALTRGHFLLDPVLFRLLFGVDAVLTNSPVVLCGLPDGRLCFLTLTGSQVHVLLSLEQPVAFVGASVVAETGAGHALCLAAVGERGKVVLVRANEAAEARFTEGRLPGPVVCVQADKQRLYYSTGPDLLVLDLLSETGGSKAAAAQQNPVSLNVCGVAALAELTCSSTGELELLGLSCRGRLQRIILPLERDDTASSNVPSTQMGRSIGDVLAAIGDVCERASILKSTIKSKNQTLSHLNQVLNIGFLLKADGETEKPIRCSATTTWSRQLQEDSLNLTCVLDNGSPYTLEQRWTLSVAVSPLCCCSSSSCTSSCYSFPFHSLHPGEKLEVSLPLLAPGDASFPVTISCSLIFSLAGLLGEEEAIDLCGSQSSCISLPLNTLMVDWLHAMQLDNAKAMSQPHNITTTEAVQAFLMSRQRRNRTGGAGESAQNPGKQQYSASVRVSSDLLRDTLMTKTSDTDPPPNICFTLLDWLLSEGPGAVKRGQRADWISSSVVHARDPHGHAVKITAKEVNPVEESLAIVEVQVKSWCMAAVCGLHHAVLSRVQALLLNVPERETSSNKLHSSGLRQALQQAEIQQSRVSGALCAGVCSGQMTLSLLNVYRELRQNPLVII